jgi:hypothetical protein
MCLPPKLKSPPALQFGEVKRISVKGDQAKQHFIEEYLRKGVPVVLTDVLDSWPAKSKWTKEFFKQGALGQMKMQYHHTNNGMTDFGREQGSCTLAEFITKLDAGEQLKHMGQAHPAYDFINQVEGVLDDIDLGVIDELMPDSSTILGKQTDPSLFPFFPPYPPGMFMSGSGTRSPGHYDGDFSHTFHWLLWGRKQVHMMPYDVCPDPAYLWKCMGTDFTTEGLSEDDHPILKGGIGWATTLEAGEFLVLPKCTWHYFDSIDGADGSKSAASFV